MTTTRRLGFRMTVASLAALAGLSLALACEQTHAREHSEGTGEGAPRVALLLGTLQEERYQKDQEYFEQKARQLGLSPFTLSADNDDARQLSQVEDALARGAKILVIQPTDSSAAASYVGKAKSAGAKVVAYDRPILGADVWAAHDSYKVGQLQAEEALKATGGKGNYILLNGQSGSSVAEAIARGYRETLAPAVKAGQVKIVLDKSHAAWSPEQALKTVEDALTKTHGNIDAILANNSGLARGAVQAIVAAGRSGGEIFIAGADADAANVNYVCEGKQSIEVLKDIRALAETAAVLAAKLARGESVTSNNSWTGVPVFGSPVQLVTKDNVKSSLIDSGFHDKNTLTSCTDAVR
jgi:D-xylose transport system substrate-binding protein